MRSMIANISMATPLFKHWLAGLFLFCLAGACFKQAHGATFVCVNLDGKKIFSEIACDKRGLQAASADFPVIQAPAQQAQPVFILTPETEAQASNQVAIPAPQGQDAANAARDARDAQGNLIKKNPRPNIWKSPLKIGGVGLFILLLMPIASSFFLGYYVVMYFRRRALRLQDLEQFAAKD